MRNIFDLSKSLQTVCIIAASQLAGCAITSPYWGYEPESITTPIPFQAFGLSTNPLYIECASDTGGHGNPSDGEASYIAVATMVPSTSPSLDSTGQAIYSASKSIALPSQCWEWFGDYGFWQANVRVVALDGQGKKVPLASYDKAGLECLGREVGKAARWNGSANKGCEKKYLGTNTVIPYIVLRIDGYQNGIDSALSFSAPKRLAATALDVLPLDAAPVNQVLKVPADGELMQVGAVRVKP